MTRRLDNRHILITGSRGYIGTHLARCFLEEGARVRGCGLPMDGDRSYPYEEIDLTRGIPPDLLAGQDLLVHCAGQPSIYVGERDPVADFMVNACASVQIFHAATERKVRVIFPSTIAVYGEPIGAGDLIEEMANPSTCYGTSKRTAEQYLAYFARNSGIKHTALRLSYVYGPGVSRGPVADFFRAYEGHGPTRHFMSLDSVLDFLYLDDLLEAFVRVAEGAAQMGGIFNLGTGRGVKLSELGELIRSEMGQDPKHALEPAQTELPTKRLVLDSSRFLANFGWSPQIAVEDGLRRVARALQSNVHAI